MNKHPFLFCGFIGWCLEILWTGLHSLLQGDASMKGTTSLLMFPIYGLRSPYSSSLQKDQKVSPPPAGQLVYSWFLCR